jgi:hypothetical protein
MNSKFLHFREPVVLKFVPKCNLKRSFCFAGIRLHNLITFCMASS